jgi:hypothetical protein
MGKDPKLFHEMGYFTEGIMEFMPDFLVSKTRHNGDSNSRA